MAERSAPRAEIAEYPEDLERALGTPFETVLADPNRLRIQAALQGLAPDGSIRFTALAHALHLSDGNLASHLAVLTEVGYVTSTETYTGRRRTRWFAATPAGRDAFASHLAQLQAIIDFAALDPQARAADSAGA